MKKVPLVLFLLATLLLTTTLEGITFRHPYTGPLRMKFSDWDMGTVYQVPGAPVVGSAAVNALPQTPYDIGPGGHFYDVNGNRDDAGGYNAALREDVWGIARLTRIENAANASDVLWLDGDNNEEIMVMFYGGIDVAIAPGPIAGQTVIQVDQLKFDFYQQAFGTFVAAGDEDQGALGRTGFATYNGVTGGTSLWTTVLNKGFAGIAGAGNAGFLTFFTPDVTGTTGSGNFQLLLDITGGTAQAAYDTNSQINGADFFTQGTTAPNDGSSVPIAGLGNGQWTVFSDDPIRCNVIPEPVTLLGLMLGMSSLGGYLRRRLV